ncbi:MAG: polysaccharide lyase family 8 super-sandwich domain-containing protein [Rikenellaceae bacterium]
MKLRELKKLLLIAVLSLPATALFGQVIQFDKLEIDLGEVKIASLTDNIVTAEFEFVNAGDKKLEIKQVIPSCGSILSYDKTRTYQPGERGRITMSCDVRRFITCEQSFNAEIYSTAINSGTQKGVHLIRLNFSVDNLLEIATDAYPLRLEAKSSAIYTPSNIYQTILSRAATELRASFSEELEREAEYLVKVMQKGGWFASIDYDCIFRTDWQPSLHLDYLLTLSICYAEPQSKYYLNSDLFEAINDGLQFWLKKSPTSHNWWHNQIGGSQKMADLLAVLHSTTSRIDQDLLVALCESFAGSNPSKFTGANKSDIARHHLYRGCLLEDEKLVRYAVEESFYAIRITEKEGIQEDMSYHQHGAQLYIGGYGTAFLDGVSQIATLLIGTPYQLDSEKLAIFSSFVREGYFKTFRGPYIDWSVVGRSISRKGARLLDTIDTSTMYWNIIDRMILIDGEHKEEYLLIKKRMADVSSVGLDLPCENRYYHRSDYMLHSNPNYVASVRTASERLQKAENGNGENLKSCYLSDGAFNVRQSGDEYDGLYGVWDWTKIPGTTSPDELQELDPSWGAMGTSTLTAGVSNGAVGAFAYAHDDRGFTAKKGWFLFEDFIVALGADIDASSMNLQTTLDQSFLKSKVKVKTQEGEKSYATIEQRIENPDYIIHNNMAFVPLQSGQFDLKASAQSGNWNSINYNQEDKEITEQVFSLVWRHGQSAKGAEYSYIQIPNCGDKSRIEQIRSSLSVTNRADLQAATYENYTMILFYKRGSYSDKEVSVKVDRPALVLLERVDSGVQMSLTNLAGDSKPVSIQVTPKGGKKSKIVINTSDMRVATHAITKSPTI